MEEDDLNTPQDAEQTVKTPSPKPSEDNVVRPRETRRVAHDDSREDEEVRPHALKPATTKAKKEKSRSREVEKKKSKAPRDEDAEDDEDDSSVKEDSHSIDAGPTEDDRTLKAIRNYVERPKTPEEKKRTIKNKKSAPAASHYKTLVIDTNPVNLGTFSSPQETPDDSMNKISVRRKSISRERGSSATRVYTSKSRLKFYSEDKPAPPSKPSRHKVSPPLVIPNAYVPLITREYGNKLPTLEEFEKEMKEKSASKERNRKSSGSVTSRKSENEKTKKSTAGRSSQSKDSDDEDEDEDDTSTSHSKSSSRKSLDNQIERLQEQHKKNKVTGQQNREMSSKRKSTRQ